jgi:hypothetical protein
MCQNPQKTRFRSSFIHRPSSTMNLSPIPNPQSPIPPPTFVSILCPQFPRLSHSVSAYFTELSTENYEQTRLCTTFVPPKKSSPPFTLHPAPRTTQHVPRTVGEDCL